MNAFKSTFEMSTSHYYSLMLLYNVYQRIYSLISYFIKSLLSALE